jgi:hypothetical protein
VLQKLGGSKEGLYFVPAAHLNTESQSHRYFRCNSNYRGQLHCTVLGRKDSEDPMEGRGIEL